MQRKKAILFIFGNGGHKEQARRLLNLLQLHNEFPDINIISLSEKNQIIDNYFDEAFFAPELRPKLKAHLNFLIIFMNSILQLFLTIKILTKYQLIVTISTGPGISIIPIYITKSFRVPNIFIESWSKFESKTLTGSFMYPISDLFFIQNKELKDVCPKAIYSGRL